MSSDVFLVNEKLLVRLGGELLKFVRQNVHSDFFQHLITFKCSIKFSPPIEMYVNCLTFNHFRPPTFCKYKVGCNYFFVKLVRIFSIVKSVKSVTVELSKPFTMAILASFIFSFCLTFSSTSDCNEIISLILWCK